MTIGSETSGGIRNVVAANMTAVGTEAGIRIKSRRGRGGEVSNVRFSNWVMRDVGTGIEVTNYYMMEGERRDARTMQPVNAGTPRFRNIAIDGVTMDGAKALVTIDGLPESPIDGLRLTDVVGTGRAGLVASNTKALELHNVQMNVETGAGFAVSEATDAELDGVASRKLPAGAPVVRLEQSPGIVVRNSRVFAGVGSGVLVSVPAGEAKSVTMVGDGLLKEDAK